MNIKQLDKTLRCLHKTVLHTSNKNYKIYVNVVDIITDNIVHELKSMYRFKKFKYDGYYNKCDYIHYSLYNSRLMITSTSQKMFLLYKVEFV